MTEVLFWGRTIMAICESKIGIASEETKSSKDIVPPGQHISVSYRNGTGAMVKEEITSRSFEDSKIVDIIREEIREEAESFRPELNRIRRKKREFSGKKRHGGRLVPRSELPQRRKALEELAKEESKIREEMDRKGFWKRSVITGLGDYLKTSDPLNPLQLRVPPTFNTIEIIEGTSMEEGDQGWWAFIREAPEIWTLHQTGRERDYGILHKLFIGRFNLREAKLGPLEKEKEVQAELDRITGEISEMLDEEEYTRIDPLIQKITQHFPE